MQGKQKKRARLEDCLKCKNRTACDLRINYVVINGCPLFIDEKEVKWYVKGKERILSAWGKIFSKQK